MTQPVHTPAPTVDTPPCAVVKIKDINRAAQLLAILGTTPLESLAVTSADGVMRIPNTSQSDADAALVTLEAS